ncbi:MAG: hypothetical protein HY332_15885 [Chloroflexi bacterium]|nr:hypothetical protein [Chloroflexota bacterium]
MQARRGGAPRDRVTSQDITQRLPVVGRAEPVQPDRQTEESGAARSASPNPISAAWADPEHRPWLIVGGLAIVFLVAIIVAAPAVGRQFAARPTPAPGEAPSPLATLVGDPGASQLMLAALPLLLGLFWLFSAWLVDAEARRAFVVREPWGERRTVAYSCLAVGCVFPLILAGLIFAAWGFVSFVIFVANRYNWIAGIQAGALILLLIALFLLARNIIARWLTERRERMFR